MRKKIYILPTRYGLLFLIILVAMLAGSANYNNNLGFLLTFLLGSMAFISVLHTFRNISGIQIVSVRTKPVFANQKAVFEFIVRMGATPQLAISFRFPGGETTRGDILPDKGNSVRDNLVSVRVMAEQRGIFRPGPLHISTEYPLGLFRSWYRLYLDLECTVYPRPFSGFFDPVNADSSAYDNDTENEAGPGVDDFKGLKAYQPGDPLQHISWKAFSRGQGLLTKEFVTHSGSSVVLDWYALKDSDTERKLSKLCDMVLKANRLNLEYELRLPGKTIGPDKGEAHKHNCLKSMAIFALPPEDV